MNVSAALFEPAGVGLATALQMANLVVLAAGVLFGALASWLTGWARPVVWLALLAPFAQVLEPLAGVAMLIGVLSGAAACSGPFNARRLVWTFGLTLAAGLVMAVIAPWLGPLFRGFKSVDRVWLSVAAMVGAVGLAWAAGSVVRDAGDRRWIAPVLLLTGVVAGAAVFAVFANSPVKVRPDISLVALGLLALGPAAAVLTGRSGLPGSMRSDHPHTVLPWFALGLPMTAAAALMADVLFGQGLIAGPQTLMSRPKIGWGIWAAILMAGLLAMVLAAALARVPLSPSVQRQRIIAGLVLLGVIAMSAWRGAAVGDVVVLATAALVGYACVRFDIDPSPLIVGLVIAELGIVDFERALRAGGVAGLVSQVQWLPVMICITACGLAAWLVRRREPEAV